MRILGIIPSRFDSSRFPGKPLIDLNGKSMIQRVYEGASKSNKIDHLIVATDDQRILDEVKRFGGNVILTSKEHVNGTMRCVEVLKHFPDTDIVINIQGDEPLVRFEQLDLLLEAFWNDEVEITTLGIKVRDEEELDNPNRIKLVTDYQNNALYFSRSKISEFNYLRHIGLYAYKAETLKEITELPPSKIEEIESLEQLRWLYYGKKIKVVETEIETPNIDTPEDIKKVLEYL
jgi:3-deoxy-manno-octulosonate cytidylyltransferase (CMP-KDO synthetase)